MIKNEAYKPTSEEEYIQYYLEDSNIKFKEQFILKNLKEDIKSHRKVDFYLKNLGVYVEYYGLYNKSKKHREEYDFKAQLYIKNSLPTVFIYPHELGFLDYAFHSKMKRLYKVPKFRKKSKILRYFVVRYFTKGKPYYILIAFFWYLLWVIFGGIDLGLHPFIKMIFKYGTMLLSFLFMGRFVFNFVKYVIDKN